MKLITYIEQYARLSLNYHEIKAFAIPNMKKGWKKRYAELEIPDSFVEDLAATISPAKKVKRQQKKLKKKLDFAVAYEKTSDQLLYLMENNNGLLKIGISIEPVRRARNLTTASGVPVHLVAVWKLDKNTRKVEGQLHKSFSKYRLEGDWFSPGSVTPEKIEAKISCNWERMLLNKSLEERKLKAKPTDSYQYSSIKVETAKAILFIIDGKEQWCPKSRIYHLNTETLEIKVTKGQFDQPILEKAA